MVGRNGGRVVPTPNPSRRVCVQSAPLQSVRIMDTDGPNDWRAVVIPTAGPHSVAPSSVRTCTDTPDSDDEFERHIIMYVTELIRMNSGMISSRNPKSTMDEKPTAV